MIRHRMLAQPVVQRLLYHLACDDPEVNRSPSKPQHVHAENASMSSPASSMMRPERNRLTGEVMMSAAVSRDDYGSQDADETFFASR